MKQINDAVIERYRARVVIPDDPDACWGWIGSVNVAGYGIVKLYVEGRQWEWRATHVSWWIHHGVPLRDCALHHCDNRPCTNPRHLYDGTRQQNVRDRDARGRHRSPDKRGERHHLAKLTDDQVRELRMHDDGKRGTAAALARQYAHLGISRQAMSDILRRRTWKHLD